MVLFCSEQEFVSLKEDGEALAARADEYIRGLLLQLETQRARADAATINAEQTCSLIEQKYMSVTSEVEQLEQEKTQVAAELEQRSSELAEAKSQAHQLQLNEIQAKGELERARAEIAELQRGKQALLDTIEQKNTELEEKNRAIQSYLDKIVSLTEDRSRLEGTLRDNEAEVVRSRASQARLVQEKELLEQHNSWLSEELMAKSNALLEDRRRSAEVEAELRSALAEAQKCSEEATERATRSQERLKEQETELDHLRKQVKQATEDAALQIEQLLEEIATATRLVELHKENAEEASKKANELEGVISAMEAHMNQLEDENAEKIHKEVKAREAAIAEAKKTQEQLEAELAKAKEAAAAVAAERDGHELALTRVKTLTPLEPELAAILHSDARPPPGLATGGSSTALAAALLRDGWSLTQMYSRYQEAADAWRHERQERVQAQALLELIGKEVNAKLLIVEEERAEYGRMLEAYNIMETKLRAAADAKADVDGAVVELKADLRKREREAKSLEVEVADMQSQVAVLLKELRDLHQQTNEGAQMVPNGTAIEDFGRSALDRSLTIKDIQGLVEANSQLRIRVRALEDELQHKSAELQEVFAGELERRSQENANAMERVLEEYRKQDEVVKAQKSTLDLYKRLYEEEVQLRRAGRGMQAALVRGTGEATGADYRALLEDTQEELQRLREDMSTHLKDLQQEINQAREEASTARVERARAEAEAKYAREVHESIAKNMEDQRKEMEGVLRRNMEFSQTITEYQRRLRDSSQAVQTAEENARRMTIQASVLEREKELLAAAEQRASQEVASLSDRIHRLQATLDTVRQAEEAREATHAADRKRLEDDINRLQREWAEAKRDLEMERSHARDLVLDRDRAAAEGAAKVEAAAKAAEEACHAVSLAETRAQVLQARLEEVQGSLKKAEDQLAAVRASGGEPAPAGQGKEADLAAAAEEAQRTVERAQEDLAATKAHLAQYKSIAQANEDAANKISEAYAEYRREAEQARKAGEEQVEELTQKLAAKEAELVERSAATGAQLAEAEKLVAAATNDATALRKSEESTRRELEAARERIAALQEDVESSHKKWRDAQDNFQKQVLSQGETIRELQTVSQRLDSVEGQLREALARAETAEAALAREQVSWQASQESLQAAKAEAEKRLAELEQQNRILLDRLEASHVTAAEAAAQQRAAAAPGTEQAGPGEAVTEGGDDKLQEVIRYLRRAKETSDTELLMLKQERLRIQRQLDAATRDAQEARTQLRAELEKSRSSVHSHEEFESLKAQIEQMSLLRESNAMLREENKRSFEDARQWRERARQLEADVEPLQGALRSKDVDLEAAAREVESAKAEAGRWQQRVNQLLEKYKAVDLEEYERVQAELAAAQEKLKAREDELEKAKQEAAEIQSKVAQLEDEVAKKEARVTSLEKELEERSAKVKEVEENLEKEKQAAATWKGERVKLNNAGLRYKRSWEAVVKEKEQLAQELEGSKGEKESLAKQLEEAKAVASETAKKVEEERKAREAAARQSASSANQQAAAQTRREADNEKRAAVQLQQLKEKYQTLQRQFQQLKDSRQKDLKFMGDVFQRADKARSEVMSELAKHREWMDKHKDSALAPEVAQEMAAAESAAAKYDALVSESQEKLESLAKGGATEATSAQPPQPQPQPQAGAGAAAGEPAAAPPAPAPAAPPPPAAAAAAAVAAAAAAVAGAAPAEQPQGAAAKAAPGGEEGAPRAGPPRGPSPGLGVRRASPPPTNHAAARLEAERKMKALQEEIARREREVRAAEERVRQAAAKEVEPVAVAAPAKESKEEAGEQQKPAAGRGGQEEFQELQQAPQEGVGFKSGAAQVVVVGAGEPQKPEEKREGEAQKTDTLEVAAVHGEKGLEGEGMQVEQQEEEKGGEGGEGGEREKAPGKPSEEGKPREPAGEQEEKGRQKRKAAEDLPLPLPAGAVAPFAMIQDPTAQMAAMRAQLLAGMRRGPKARKAEAGGGQPGAVASEAAAKEEGAEKGAGGGGPAAVPEEAVEEQAKDSGAEEAGAATRAPRLRRIVRPRIDSVPAEPVPAPPPAVPEAPAKEPEKAVPTAAVAGQAPEEAQKEKTAEEASKAPSLAELLSAQTQARMAAADVAATAGAPAAPQAEETPGPEAAGKGAAGRPGKRARPEEGEEALAEGAEPAGMSAPGVSDTRAEVVQPREGVASQEPTEEEGAAALATKRPRLVRPVIQSEPAAEETKPTLALALQEGEGAVEAGQLAAEGGLVAQGEAGPMMLEEGEMGGALEEEMADMAGADEGATEAGEIVEGGGAATGGGLEGYAAVVASGTATSVPEGAGALEESAPVADTSILDVGASGPSDAGAEVAGEEPASLEVGQEKATEEGPLEVEGGEELQDEGESLDDGLLEIPGEEGPTEEEQGGEVAGQGEEPAAEDEDGKTGEEDVRSPGGGGEGLPGGASLKSSLAAGKKPSRVTRAAMAAAAAAEQAIAGRGAGAGEAGGPAAAAGLRRKTGVSPAKAQQGAEGPSAGAAEGTVEEAGGGRGGGGRIVSIAAKVKENLEMREQRRAQRFAEKPASPREGRAARGRGRAKAGVRTTAAGGRGSGRLISLGGAAGRGKVGQPPPQQQQPQRTAEEGAAQPAGGEQAEGLPSTNPFSALEEASE